jgi:hypothetical protein
MLLDKAVCFGLLQIHLSTLVLAATSPAPKPAQLLDILPSPSNLTLLHNPKILVTLLHCNLTLPQASQTVSATNRLPVDPLSMRTVTGGSVKFHHYEDDLNPADVFATLVQAQRECITHMLHAPNARIGTTLIYLAGNVTLDLSPLTATTWAMWSATVVLVLLFVDTYEFVEFRFDIVDPDLGYAGGGRLRRIRG